MQEKENANVEKYKAEEILKESIDEKALDEVSAGKEGSKPWDKKKDEPPMGYAPNVILRL